MKFILMNKLFFLFFMIMESDCNHYGGTYLDKDAVKRCVTCDEPADDHQLDEY